ncbi:hypothetical protein ATO12_07435 [Aquimarina atlantica]|uniref:Peptidase S74 domain-containing protein n=1 Tax=Aquimarina atlantica TaxID=1317122 RepID=A0A023BNK9_9FLAO|nr:hypothetical protein [Aquimarina atlantica]EZH71524.1 hypothetical protein ATO12_07435 [Aquimarina atlantica]
MKKTILTLVLLGFSLGIEAQDLISGGQNSWIFHTPDDNRTTLYIAPKTNGNWDWSKTTSFLNDGKVNFANTISVNGNISGKDIISEGQNSWIFHTPDDNRTTLYIAPKTNGNWDWSKTTSFLNDGKVNFANTISVNGNISGKDIISEGQNSWIFHTPDDNRTTLYIAPKTNGNWDWSKTTSFFNDGKVNFVNNISIRGKIETKEIIVTTSPTADFVFESDYQLPSLDDIEKHIKEKKHLPQIASAKEMKENGVNVGDFQVQLLQKIEELTLYTIQQEKEIRELKSLNTKLQELNLRLEKLESQR